MAPQQKKPEATKAPVGVRNNSDNSGQNGPNPIILVCLFSLLAVAALITAWFVMGRKKGSRSVRSRKQRAILIFRNINKLLGYLRELGIKGGSLEDCEEYVKKNCLLFEPAAFEDFMEIIRKARFGNGNITEEELDRVTWFYQDLFHKVYDRLSISMKLYLKINKSN
jgi:hypothetical protein